MRYACTWRSPWEGDCSVCMYSHWWLTGQHQTRKPFHSVPRFFWVGTVASICTALYHLRCSLGFYFPFHTPPSPHNLKSCFFLPGDFTVGNLKSLPLTVSLLSCHLPKSHFLDCFIVVSVYLSTSFPAVNTVVLKYVFFLNNSFCLKIQPGYSPVNHLCCDSRQGRCFTSHLGPWPCQAMLHSFFLIGHVSHGPTE